MHKLNISCISPLTAFIIIFDILVNCIRGEVGLLAPILSFKTLKVLEFGGKCICCCFQFICVE